MSDDKIDILIQTRYNNANVRAAHADVEALSRAGAQNAQAQAKTAAASAQAATAQQRLATEQARTAATSAQGAVNQQRHATETQRTAAASNRAATEAQRLATEQQRTATTAANAAAAHARAEKATLQYAQAQERAANSSSRAAGFAQQMGDAFKGSLLDIVGPAAVATAAIAGVVKVAESFGEAFQFKAQLDSTTASINSQLGSVRDMSTVWAEAAAVGRTYRITQEQTNAILASSVDVLRTSEASVGELEIALLRLQSRDPSKPISEAARALRELNAGDTATIKELFNIGAQDANRMKNEIQGGADAVRVLSDFLDRAGSGMNILEQRTTGAMGKMNELAVKQEELALAQAKFAQGPGMEILLLQIEATEGATQALSGELEGVVTISDTVGRAAGDTWNYPIQAISDYNSAVLGLIGTAVGLIPAFEEVAAGGTSAAVAAVEQAVAVTKVATALVDTRRESIDAAQAIQRYTLSLTDDRQENIRASQEIRATGESARAAASDMEKLRSAKASIFSGGVQATGVVVEDQASFFAEQEARAAEHAQKMAELQRDLEQAKTKEQRAGVQERIAAEEEGFAEQEQAAAVSYALQQAEQKAHLGQMLIDYVNNQAAMNKIGADEAAALTQAIAKEYGVQQSLAETTFAAQVAAIDNWAASGGMSAQALAGQLGTAGQSALDTQLKMDALAKTYTAQLIQNFNDGKIDADQLRESLERIPSKVYSEVIITEKRNEAARDRGREGGMMGGGEDVATGSSQGGNQVGRGGRALSGGGRAASGGGGNAVATLTEASAILEQIIALGDVHKKFIKPLQLYRQTLGTAIELLTAVSDFHVSASAAISSPIPPELIVQLVAESRLILDLTRHALVPTNERQVEIFERYASTVQSSIGVLSDMAGLRQTLSDALKNSSPFDVVAVAWLARRAQEFTALVLGQLIALTEKQAASLEQYATGAGAAVDIIGGLAGLRQTMTEAMKDSAPFDAQQVAFLILRAKQFTEMVRAQLIPLSEQQANELANFATAVEAGVSIIGGMADLRQTVTAAMKDSQPFDTEQIRFLVVRAKQFTDMVRGQLIPLTEDQASELTRWADGVGAATAVIDSMANLRATPPGPPISEAWVRRMAADANRVTAIVRDELLPTTQEQSEELQRWSEAVQAAVGAAAAPLELSGQMFADYVSPSDAQLDLVVADAKRLTNRLMAAAATYSKDGLEAGKAYAEGVGATFGAFNEGLVFIDRLRFSDLAVDSARLAQFQQSTLTTLDVLSALGERAAAIPPANLVALQSANAALSSTADAMISMSAVPFGNLPAMSANLGAMGGGSSTTTNTYHMSNTFVLPSGTTQQMAREVLAIVDQQMRSRR
jgi:hypothetical protein